MFLGYCDFSALHNVFACSLVDGSKIFLSVIYARGSWCEYEGRDQGRFLGLGFVFDMKEVRDEELCNSAA